MGKLQVGCEEHTGTEQDRASIWQLKSDCELLEDIMSIQKVVPADTQLDW